MYDIYEGWNVVKVKVRIVIGRKIYYFGLEKLYCLILGDIGGKWG